MGKEMSYYNLFDEIKDDCCPICKLINRRTDQMMKSFLYDGINDVYNRKYILDTHGFCKYHSNMLMDMGDPLAHAIIYKDLINLAVKDIKKGNCLKYSEHKDCLFCKEAEKCEKDYIYTFAKGFRDNIFKEKYIKSGMLCIPHLHMILKADKDIYPLIEKETLLKYKRLTAYLDEIIKKSDYRFSKQEWSQEAKRSWKLAVYVINGH